MRKCASRPIQPFSRKPARRVCHLRSPRLWMLSMLGLVVAFLTLTTPLPAIAQPATKGNLIGCLGTIRQPSRWSKSRSSNS
jgi:hypothetical protein